MCRDGIIIFFLNFPLGMTSCVRSALLSFLPACLFFFFFFPCYLYHILSKFFDPTWSVCGWFAHLCFPGHSGYQTHPSNKGRSLTQGAGRDLSEIFLHIHPSTALNARPGFRSCLHIRSIERREEAHVERKGWSFLGHREGQCPAIDTAALQIPRSG